MVKGDVIQEPGGFWTFRTTCPRCEKPAEVRGLRKRAIERWQQGVLVQNAFPALSVDDLEILASGMHSECFDAWFPPGLSDPLGWF
jgi:hypothetical protein